MEIKGTVRVAISLFLLGCNPTISQSQGLKTACFAHKRHKNQRMDYDSTDIPAVYDRGRDHGPEMFVEKISAGADSVLAQLSTSEFQAGLEAMRAHAAGGETKAVCEPIDVFVFR